MGKITAKEIASLAKGKVSRTAIGDGLYFVVAERGHPYWALRYTSNGKRKQMTLGKYNVMSLVEARAEAVLKTKDNHTGLDPLLARRQAEQIQILTVDALFEDWHKGNIKRLKHPNIPERIYRKDIAPHIGQLPLDKVTARDIRTIIESITESKRPTISNDALGYCKQLFRHANKLDLVGNNPAAAFAVSDAGGVEQSKERYLSIDELTFFFKVAAENSTSFSRENYLACALLVCLGVRKSELVESKWSEYDLDKQTWSLPKERSKTGVGIDIPLSDVVMSWLKELEVRGFGSEYVFPSRRAGKLPHMGKDTLNRAITMLFGRVAGKEKQPPNLMGDIKHFTVHDLRRTCRTLLSKQGTSGYIAERCLNHKLKGVEGIYDKYDYFEERKEAQEQLSMNISLIVGSDNQLSRAK